MKIGLDKDRKVTRNHNKIKKDAEVCRIFSAKNKNNLVSIERQMNKFCINKKQQYNCLPYFKKCELFLFSAKNILPNTPS